MCTILSTNRTKCTATYPIHYFQPFCKCFADHRQLRLATNSSKWICFGLCWNKMQVEQFLKCPTLSMRDSTCFLWKGSCIWMGIASIRFRFYNTQRQEFPTKQKKGCGNKSVSENEMSQALQYGGTFQTSDSNANSKHIFATVVLTGLFLRGNDETSSTL